MNKKDDNCKHEWAHGYTMDVVVFCKKCNKDWDEVYEEMPYDEAVRLVKDEK